MGRLVDHDASEPRILDESDIHAEKGDIAVCQCGLSAEYPFCDGTHRETSDEDEDSCYRYVREDGTVNRREIDHVEYTDGAREYPGEDSD